MNISNVSWVFAERLASTVLNVLSIVAIARLLGPSDYGEYAYVISLTGIVLATGQLGLDGLLIKKIIGSSVELGSLLGSTCLLKYFVYLPASVLLVIYGFGNSAHSSSEQYLILFSTLILLAAPITTTLLAWLNAHELFRFASAARIAVITVGVAAKISVIFAGMGLIAVGLIHSLIFVGEAVLLLVVFRIAKGPAITSWQPKKTMMKELFQESRYLFVGTLLTVLYFNVDMLMIRLMLGSRAVGEYALVPQILQASQILPYAMTLVTFPALLKLVHNNSNQLANACIKQYAQLIAIAALIAAAVAITAPFLLPAVFGNEYIVTVPALQLACLAIPFLFIRQLNTKLFIAFELGRTFVKIEALGFVINVGLNFCLIPEMRGYGAAISSVVALAFSTCIAFILFPGTRQLMLMLLKKKS
jgi:O-antigen/teichoic acid export membrane protein